jgi:large subunit ribosomal protein L24
MISRVKKNDLVFVTSGRDKGKQGIVLQIDRKLDQVMVKDVCVITRHVKIKRPGDKGGIIKEESLMSLSKVMPICPSCKKPCRVQVKLLAGENKTRTCHRCKEAF